MSAIGTHLPIFSHQFYQIFIREVIGQNVGLRMASSSTRTDRQTRFWNPHMETCRHTKNFNSKLKISG